LSVSDGGSAVTGSDSNNNNQSGDTTGDVLANDTDADGDASLVVSAISGGTLGQGVAGTYGTLTLNANGSYTYVANQSGADDDPVGVNDTGYINEDATLSVSDGGSAVTGSDSNNNNESGDTTGDVLANDTDADGDSSLVSFAKTSPVVSPLSLLLLLFLFSDNEYNVNRFLFKFR
jgi:VCBS repeat-containing protein